MCGRDEMAFTSRVQLVSLPCRGDGDPGLLGQGEKGGNWDRVGHPGQAAPALLWR